MPHSKSYISGSSAACPNLGVSGMNTRMERTELDDPCKNPLVFQAIFLDRLECT